MNFHECPWVVLGDGKNTQEKLVGGVYATFQRLFRDLNQKLAQLILCKGQNLTG